MTQIDDLVLNPGKIWYFRDSINTDLIVPGRFLTENNPEVIVKHAFEGVLKNFANLVKENDIIVAGKNFGCGSSREEAVFVVKELEICCIVAESFSRIYYRNLINNGIPAITIPNARVIFSDSKITKIDIPHGYIEYKKNSSVLHEKIEFPRFSSIILEYIRSKGVLNLLRKKLY